MIENQPVGNTAGPGYLRQACSVETFSGKELLSAFKYPYLIYGYLISVEKVKSADIKITSVYIENTVVTDKPLV